MHRFFVPAHLLGSPTIVLGGSQAHQMRRVLRLRPSEHVVLLDNQGWAYEARLVSYDGDDVRLEAISRQPAAGEPLAHIVLFQAVLKGDRFEFVVQKATELGVRRLVPMVCERSVVAELGAIQNKHDRWQRVAQEAAEQCGRGLFPEVAPCQPFSVALSQALRPCAGAEQLPALRLIPWEEERAVALRSVLESCNFMGGACIQIYIGPEGGFTEAEIALACSHGVRAVSLGPRILRSETAALVAVSNTLYATGDLGLPPAGGVT